MSKVPLWVTWERERESKKECVGNKWHTRAVGVIQQLKHWLKTRLDEPPHAIKWSF